MKGKKKLLAVCLFLCCGIFLGGCQMGKTEEEKNSIRIGVSLYRGDDTFINNIRSELEKQAKSYEQQTGIRVTLDIQDAKGNQNTQNNQVERFISLGCDVVCINPVDRTNAAVVIDKPVEEDMDRWDQLYYIGIDAKESAVLQGTILVEQYKKNPRLLDRNGDGVVSYVLLEGESSHQDAVIRTEWAIRTLKDHGVPVEKLTGGIANWERSQASALMEQWLEAYPDQIELVISNNDDMALGAIDAMERMGAKDIQVVGIDGTIPGIEAVESGKMLGTVSSDKEKFAWAIFSIAADKAMGQPVREELQKELEEGKYYRGPQKIVEIGQEN